MRTSGAHSRSAAASRASGSSASAHSSQPICDPAPGTGRSSGSIAITSGASSESRARSASARSWLLGRPQRGVGHRLRVDVGQRRRGHAAVGPQDAAAVGGGRVGGVAPALLAERRPLPRAAAHQAAAAIERALEPRGGLRRRDAEPRRHDQVPRGRVGGAVVVERAVVGPADLQEPLGGAVAELVADLAGLLERAGVLARALPRRQPRERRASDLGPRGQQLQRGDQRVAPEQRVEAPGVALLDRRGRRVRPALVGQQRVDLSHRARPPSTVPARRRTARRRSRSAPSRGRRSPRARPRG